MDVDSIIILTKKTLKLFLILPVAIFLAALVWFCSWFLPATWGLVVMRVAPHIPFYNYYGVEPPNDSWTSCKGIVQTYVEGNEYFSDNEKKFEYWAIRAIKENNPKLCNNVGVSEGGDQISSDQHRQAIEECKYIYENNLTHDNYYLKLNLCGNVY